MIEGFHHIALIAGNYARSKRFYTEVLGFEVIAETFRRERQSFKLDLRVPGGGQLELFSFPDPPKRPSGPEFCGLRHLAFRVSDLDSVIAHLRSHEVEVEDIRVDALTGARFTFFADPDGIPLELYEIVTD